MNMHDKTLKSPNTENHEIEIQLVKMIKFVSAVFIGFICGAGLISFLYNTPVTYSGIDHNNDGKLDETWYYVADRLLQAEIDRNFDGKTDLIFYYNHRGIIEYNEQDDNFDGIFETETFYDKGNIEWSQSDINRDGSIDVETHYKFGKLKKVIFYDPVNYNPIKIQRFGHFHILSAEVDTDGNGVPDTFYEYNNIEEIVKKTKKNER